MGQTLVLELQQRTLDTGLKPHPLNLQTQKAAPCMKLDSGRDQGPDRGTASDHVTATAHPVLCTYDSHKTTRSGRPRSSAFYKGRNMSGISHRRQK